MAQENKPTNMWLDEPMADEPSGYQEHWLDTKAYFATSGKTAEFVYIITEPDSLTLSQSLQGAEKIGEIGVNGIYRLINKP